MDHDLAAIPTPLTRRDALTATAIFLVALCVLWFSPIKTVGDAKYTLLVTQSLLSRGSFLLDGYGLPNHPLPTNTGTIQDGDIYQIEIVDGHLYYYFPPGSSILSAPFVAIADALGYSVVRGDHTYNLQHEQAVQRAIASLLMAILAGTFYFTARLFLPVGWSTLIALGGVLGTQAWSTASRALWTHTWGMALLGYAIYLVAAQETGRRKLNPVVLATVLSWTYFVRPTNSLFIIGITILLVLRYRALFLAYAATGAAWFAAFVVYSWAHFGRPLPHYYQANRLVTTQFWEALPGNLISPSRGVFVYVPVSLFVIYLIARYWRWVSHRALVFLTAAVSACHLAAVSCFVPWFGGRCYGPRYTAELVPWFVLLAALGTQAALREREDDGRPHRALAWRATLAVGGALLLLSGWINWRGANEIVTEQWNWSPVSVDDAPWRVWDWRHPQILAGLVATPTPAVFPAIERRRIDFGYEAGKALEWDGWSGSDADFCWTDGRWATLVFTEDDPTVNHLHLCFGPYLHGKKIPRQRVTIDLNGRRLAAFSDDQPQAREYVFGLPAGALQRKNVLTFRLPDAASPKSVGESADDRTLGIALRWLELDDQPAALGTPVP